ncbi:MAG: outer membrane beta-barrel protein [Williamsia sp.]|nr:outer membrane beta-barrel protein [Williamsia sp.]
MKRLICLPVFLLSAFACFSQLSSGGLEGYVTTGLFSARLSHDSTVPQRAQGHSRIGSLASYGVQYSVPAGHGISLKAGVGYGTRKYSIVKYDANLFALVLVPIGIFPGRLYNSDTFPISRVQYNNRYVEVPLSFDYNVSKQKAALQVHFGLNVRLQFLTQTKTGITPYDEQVVVNNPELTRQAQDYYKADVRSFVYTFEPYMDVSCRLFKNFGSFYRMKPFSLYASALNKKTFRSQTEFLSLGGGVCYRL